MKYTPRLKQLYKETIAKELEKELNLASKMEVPVIEKISINAGIGQIKEDEKLIEEVAKDISMITGQKPLITKTRKAISNFKIKQGDTVGMKVTLRGDMMWEFLDRLINIVLPRVKDFRGISIRAFDGHGNYSLGVREHTIFPEVDTGRVVKAIGLQVNITTTGADDNSAKLLLAKLGMPFEKKNINN